MGILFRRAALADATALVGLVEELGYPTPLDGVRARLQGLLSAPDQAVFVAEVAAERSARPEASAAPEIHGWIHVQEFLSLASDPCGLVTGLVVAAGARRRGIGRGLMAAAEAWSRARGLGAMRLRARVARIEAHSFYVGLGYELAKKQLQFRKAL